MNNWIGIGRLGRDIDLRYTQSGTAVARFTLAVDKFSKGEKKTNWINITAFGALAENANKYLHKGSKCAVSGSLETGSYQRDDGVKIPTSEIFANNIEFLDSKSEQSHTSVNSDRTVTVQREEPQQFGFQPVDEQSIPF